jgi:hypothetical protein
MCATDGRSQINADIAPTIMSSRPIIVLKHPIAIIDAISSAVASIVDQNTKEQPHQSGLHLNEAPPVVTHDIL